MPWQKPEVVAEVNHAFAITMQGKSSASQRKRKVVDESDDDDDNDSEVVQKSGDLDSSVEEPDSGGNAAKLLKAQKVPLSCLETVCGINV